MRHLRFLTQLALALCAVTAAARHAVAQRTAPAVAADSDQRAPDLFRVQLETSQGPVVIEVHRDWAPRGADRFYTLVRDGFYDDSRFFRVRAGFIVQFGIAGDPAVQARWTGRSFADDPVHQHNRRGTLAFAMTGPNTRTTQVYINLADNSRLDAQGFAPFGIVTEGMYRVDRIYSGYGESAGGGVRGGKQAPLLAGGNAYLDREFPKLDRLEKARWISGPTRL